MARGTTSTSPAFEESGIRSESGLVQANAGWVRREMLAERESPQAIWRYTRTERSARLPSRSATLGQYRFGPIVSSSLGKKTVFHRHWQPQLGHGKRRCRAGGGLRRRLAGAQWWGRSALILTQSATLGRYPFGPIVCSSLLTAGYFTGIRSEIAEGSQGRAGRVGSRRATCRCAMAERSARPPTRSATLGR